MPKGIDCLEMPVLEDMVLASLDIVVMVESAKNFDRLTPIYPLIVIRARF